MSELLPCPWCGNAVDASVVEGSTFRWRQVAGCCTPGPEVRHNTVTDDQEEAERDSKRRAIEAWNTRAALSRPEAKVSEAVAKYDQHMQAIGGCTDGHCLVQRPTGMHTNGGCRCGEDKHKARRAMFAGQELRAALCTHNQEIAR